MSSADIGMKLRIGNSETARIAEPFLKPDLRSATGLKKMDMARADAARMLSRIDREAARLVAEAEVVIDLNHAGLFFVKLQVQSNAFPAPLQSGVQVLLSQLLDTLAAHDLEKLTENIMLAASPKAQQVFSQAA